MAIDTRQKRQSTPSLLLWCFPPTVNPTGTMDGSERLAAAHVYSGISTAVTNIITIVVNYMRRREEC